MGALLSRQRTIPRPAAHVARPVANRKDRDGTLQFLTHVTAALAVRRLDANDLVRNRLLAVLKAILHQQADILDDVLDVYKLHHKHQLLQQTAELLQPQQP